jgi:hypothetical protein
LARTAEDAPTLAVGRTIPGAGITCIVISNEELLGMDPTATSKDLIACRQGASAPYRVSLFEEGAAVFDCYVGADPATGCLDLSPCFDSISPGLICASERPAGPNVRSRHPRGLDHADEPATPDATE